MLLEPTWPLRGSGFVLAFCPQQLVLSTPAHDRQHLQHLRELVTVNIGDHSFRSSCPIGDFERRVAGFGLDEP